MTRALTALSLLVFVLGCGESGGDGPVVDSNSNWLRICEDDSDCGDGRTCECGVCTSQCAVDRDCSDAYPEDEAVCVSSGDSAHQSLCAAGDGGICLPPCGDSTECGDGQVCLDGACGYLPTICEAVATWPDDSSSDEARFVELVNAVRADGGRCPSMSFPASAALRIEPRMNCAARLHSVDQIERGFYDNTNPDGDGIVEQLAAVGVDHGAWGGLVSDTADVDVAVDELLAGELCGLLLDPEFDKVGVGLHQGRWTVLLVESP